MRLIDAYALQDEIHKSKMMNPHKDPKIAKNHEFEHDHFMMMVTLQPTAMGETVCCRNNVMENNSVHLCCSCCKSYPECSDDEHVIEFGDGIGSDNICCCNKYEPLMEHDYDRGGYKYNTLQDRR